MEEIMYTKQGSINDENFLYLSDKLYDVVENISESSGNIEFNLSSIADEMKTESVGDSFIELIKTIAGMFNIEYHYFDDYSNMVNYFSDMESGKIICVRVLNTVLNSWAGVSSNIYGLMCKYIYEESFDDGNIHYTIEYPSIMFLGFTSTTLILFRKKIGSSNYAQMTRMTLSNLY